MRICSLIAVSMIVLLASACGDEQAGGSAGSSQSGGKAANESLSGQVRIDGSSTVFPITAAVAEEFQKQNPRVRVAVSYSGTGGGFKKFDLGETDINNASRPIKASEAQTARGHGVDFIELPVAYDGLTVIVNSKNDWVDYLTVEELNTIWKPDSTATKWSDIRAGWPDREFNLYGPGTDSGTFDYFTEAIMGESGASRPDYTATEDDNLIVQGVFGDVDSLGYFGIAYFEENTSKLRAVPIKNGDAEPVSPSLDTVMNARYVPLSRPLFIYVSTPAADRAEIDAFVRFYLQHGAELVKEVGYVPLPPRAYEMALERFSARVTGSVFDNEGATVGVSVEDLLSRESGSHSGTN